MRSKDEYTAAFLENDPREPHLRPKFDIAYWNWWQNARRDGGFRLGWEALPDEASEFIHAHPTLSEAIGESLMSLSGRGLH